MSVERIGDRRKIVDLQTGCQFVELSRIQPDNSGPQRVRPRASRQEALERSTIQDPTEMLPDAFGAPLTPTRKMGKYRLIFGVLDLRDDRAQSSREPSRFVLIEIRIIGITHHIEVHRGVNLDRRVCLEFTPIVLTHRGPAQEHAHEPSVEGIQRRYTCSKVAQGLKE